MRWLGAFLGALLLLLVTGCGAPTESAPGSGPPSVSQASTPTPASQQRIADRRHVGGRSWDLIIDSPAVGNQVPVRILLPAQYEQRPQQRWPVLVLLHGCCDSYISWTRSTDIEKLAANLKALVVMPDGGQAGFYSNWLDGPQWEIFRPRTAAAPHRRIPGQLAGRDNANPLGLWGDPAKQADVWKRHNPYDLADQLRSTALFVAAGNGQPGPLDLKGAVSDSIESSIGQQNRAFARRLDQLHVPVRIDLYGDGTHNWVYWQRELHRAWPMITAALLQK